MARRWAGKPSISGLLTALLRAVSRARAGRELGQNGAPSAALPPRQGCSIRQVAIAALKVVKAVPAGAIGGQPATASAVHQRVFAAHALPELDQVYRRHFMACGAPNRDCGANCYQGIKVTCPSRQQCAPFCHEACRQSRKRLPFSYRVFQRVVPIARRLVPV